MFQTRLLFFSMIYSLLSVCLWHKYNSSQQNNCPPNPGFQGDGPLQSGRTVHRCYGRSSESFAAVQNSVGSVQSILGSIWASIVQSSMSRSNSTLLSLALQTWGASSSRWIHATTRSGEKVPQKATSGTGVALQQQRPSTATMRATWWHLRVRCKPEQWKLW